MAGLHELYGVASAQELLGRIRAPYDCIRTKCNLTTAVLIVHSNLLDERDALVEFELTVRQSDSSWKRRECQDGTWNTQRNSLE